MFEKEAEEYQIRKHHQRLYGNKPVVMKELNTTYKDGFKDGYNKANEWHYVKDGDLPKENNLYLVAIKDNGLAIAYFNGLHWETKFNLGDFGHCLETVIAWCEIPKYMEKI